MNEQTIEQILESLRRDGVVRTRIGDEPLVITMAMGCVCVVSRGGKPIWMMVSGDREALEGSVRSTLEQLIGNENSAHSD